MSGHSKWHSIRHKKAVIDSKRAGAFTRLAKDITVAAREGGDPEMNFRLRLAIDRAKAANMPKENIERAIGRGTGENKDGVQVEEVIYEAYGPGQIAMLIKVLTDNKNRTISEIRNLLKKNNGKMAEGGGVAWQFEQSGFLRAKINKDGGMTADEVELAIIESGAKDYQTEEDEYLIYTLPADLKVVKENLEKQGLKVEEADLVFLAKNKIEVSDNERESYENLYKTLDEHDDVAAIFDNLL